MQDINWNDYQAFLAIARNGQIARGARAMRVNATTISRHLRRLETQIGATLFEQTREGQVLTPAGESLLAAVEHMAQAVSGIEPVNGAHGLTGSVRISVSEGFGSWIVARHLGDFAARHAGLTVDLVASSGFLSPSRREADIAVMLPRPKAGPVVARKLSDYALRLYATPAYLAEHPTIGEASDLRRGHQLVGYIPDLLYAPELGYLADIDPGLSAGLRSSSILAQHRLLAAGAGIGVLPCFIGDADSDLVRVIPEYAIIGNFWLVTHKDTHKLRRIRTVADWLVDVARRERGRLMPPAQ